MTLTIGPLILPKSDRNFAIGQILEPLPYNVERDDNAYHGPDLPNSQVILKGNTCWAPPSRWKHIAGMIEPMNEALFSAEMGLMRKEGICVVGHKHLSLVRDGIKFWDGFRPARLTPGFSQHAKWDVSTHQVVVLDAGLYDEMYAFLIWLEHLLDPTNNYQKDTVLAAKVTT